MDRLFFSDKHGKKRPLCRFTLNSEMCGTFFTLEAFCQGSYFLSHMKAQFHLVVFLIIGIPIELLAQNTSSAQAALERTAAYEQYRELNAKIINIIETQELLLRRQQTLGQRLEELSRDIEKLKEGNGRNDAELVTRDELKVYVDKLKEIDEKREADKKLILKSIRELAKIPLAPVPSPRPSRSSPEDIPTWDYPVEPGDILGDIIKAYNAEFEKQGLQSIDIRQVERVNPGLDSDRIKVGQVIKIPIPQKK